MVTKEVTSSLSSEVKNALAELRSTVRHSAELLAPPPSTGNKTPGPVRNLFSDSGTARRSDLLKAIGDETRYIDSKTILFEGIIQFRSFLR